MRVVELLENFNLLLEPLLVLYLFPRDHFACPLLASFDVLHFADHTECSGSQSLFVHLVDVGDWLGVQGDHFRFLNDDGLEWVLGIFV